jgi:arsenate reductase
MAEALFTHLAGDRYQGASAGTQPAERAHPEVVRSMEEVGIPIADRPGRLLTMEAAQRATKVIGMGCAIEEACPALRVPLEDWKLEDPKGQARDKVDAIRDEIEAKVRALIAEMDRELRS